MLYKVRRKESFATIDDDQQRLCWARQEAYYQGTARSGCSRIEWTGGESLKINMSYPEIPGLGWGSMILPKKTFVKCSISLMKPVSNSKSTGDNAF